MYFSPHPISAFNIETCKLHKSRKYVPILNKRHVTATKLLARNKQIGKKDIKYLLHTKGLFKNQLVTSDNKANNPPWGQ